MRLEDDAYEFIKGEVAHVFEMNQIHQAPIKGSELAQKMNIKLMPYSQLSLENKEIAMQVSSDGFYTCNEKGEERIYYSDDQSPQRTNMTILHEIGHAVLGHTEGNEEEEAEAAFFAKYAAAPVPLIHQLKVVSIDTIVHTFCISREAASYALDNYNKWLSYGSLEYTYYEKQMLNQFGYL